MTKICFVFNLRFELLQFWKTRETRLFTPLGLSWLVQILSLLWNERTRFCVISTANSAENFVGAAWNLSAWYSKGLFSVIMTCTIFHNFHRNISIFLKAPVSLNIVHISSRQECNQRPALLLHSWPFSFLNKILLVALCEKPSMKTAESWYSVVLFPFSLTISSTRKNKKQLYTFDSDHPDSKPYCSWDPIHALLYKAMLKLFATYLVYRYVTRVK